MNEKAERNMLTTSLLPTQMGFKIYEKIKIGLSV
jgi:hypothetical protein